MKNYYIYHVPGIKIGCTDNVPRRMKQQRYTEWEHLETHTDIYEASNREIELQKEYGYPVDSIPYYQAVDNRKDGGIKGAETTNRNKRTIQWDHVLEIRAKYKPKVYTRKMLAVEYNTTDNVIKSIVERTSYKLP